MTVITHPGATDTGQDPSSAPHEDTPLTPPARAAATPIGGELGRAAKSLLWASRKGLYPPAAMTGVYTVGAVLHDAGAHPLYAVAGGGLLLAGGVVVEKTRTWLDKAPWRRAWAAGCLAAATAWTSAAIATGAGMTTPMPALLTVGGALLAAPWWWIHRLRDTSPHPARPAVTSPAALTAPETRQAIEAAPHPHQLAWNRHISAAGLLELSSLINPEPITDHQKEANGVAWTIDGGPARHTYSRMRATLDNIKAALDRPHVDSLIYLDQDPEQYKTRGRLVVLERNPLIQEIHWPGPSLDPATGLVPVSVYPDGSGWSHYVLYQPGWGVPHDLIAGAPGTGKSGLLHLIAGESLAAGSALMLVDPHGGGSFTHLVPRATRSFLDAGEIYAGMRGLEAAHDERVAILREVGEHRMGPEFGHPMVHAVIDEASHKAVLGNPLISRLLTPIGKEGRKLWIKITLALQDPSVEAGFHDNGELRDLLLAGNVVLFRVASDRVTRTIKVGETEVAPHLLPRFFDREQKLPTTGLGYVLTGIPCELPSRTARVLAETFTANVPAGSPFDDRTGEAFQRGYERGIAELERLAEQQGQSSGPGGDGAAARVTALHAVPNGAPDADAKTALVQLFRRRGRLTISEIRQAGICSPSYAYTLLGLLSDEGVIDRVDGSRGVYEVRAS